MGAIAEGGQGLATGCNPVHLYLLKGSDEDQRVSKKIQNQNKKLEKGNQAAKKISKSRQKIEKTVQTLKDKGLTHAEAKHDFVYKTIKQEQVLDLDSVCIEDIERIRENGISDDLARKYKHEGATYLPKYLPYYKGQKDEKKGEEGQNNRWFSRIDFYIDWSEKNVTWLKKNSGKKFTGSPRNMSNSQFYLRTGFSWNLIRTHHIKTRLIKNLGIYDVGGMRLHSILKSVSDEFLTAYLNSPQVAELIEIITSTVNTQINDIKALPFIIPHSEQNQRVSEWVNDIVTIFKKCHGQLDKSSEFQVEELEGKINEEIKNLFKSPDIKKVMTT